MKITSLLAFVGSLFIGVGVAAIACPDVAEELWCHWFGYSQYSDFTSTAKAIGIGGIAVGAGVFLAGFMRVLKRS